MKNGFTLIELLAVIVVLAIIAVIVFPIIQDSINNSKEKTCLEQKRTIEYAAKRWVADNLDQIQGNDTTILISELQKSGYLTSNEDIINPITNEPMNGKVKITYISDYKQYEYNYDIDCSIN